MSAWRNRGSGGGAFVNRYIGTASSVIISITPERLTKQEVREIRNAGGSAFPPIRSDYGMKPYYIMAILHSREKEKEGK